MNGTTVTQATEVDEGYNRFEALIRQRIDSVEGPVFITDADERVLWSTYLQALPTERRGHYRCSACCSFIRKYGGLVTITDGGVMQSLLWDSTADVPPFFIDSVHYLWQVVSKAKVTGPFLWGENEQQWGTPKSKAVQRTNGVVEWTHLSGRPKCGCWKHPLLKPTQKMAEVVQDFGTLSHALSDYGPEVIAQAVRVLEAGALYRSEKALAVAQWAADLHRKLDGAKGERRRNLLWLAAATAPVGFCHLRSTVISTLLDDIKAGLNFDTISRRWSQKLHPLQYQRPSAAPTDGAIAAAEKTFAATGAAAALQRRYATLSDVQQFLWRPEGQGSGEQCNPHPQPKGSIGLFDRLRQNRQPVKELEQRKSSGKK
jgi:hypothetical protein